MPTHSATISWKRDSGAFLRGQYSRAHLWSFDGGAAVPASSSPSVVPLPYSDPAAVDPEEAFVAAIASCHMLTFLFLASKQGFQVESYHDHAVGHMANTPQGVPWVSQVLLQPTLVYSPEKRPSPEQEARLHHLAHQQCFIANSVKTEITVNPSPPNPPSR